MLPSFAVNFYDGVRQPFRYERAVKYSQKLPLNSASNLVSPVAAVIQRA